MPHSWTADELLFRPMRPRDAKAYWRIANDPDFARMTGTWGHPISVEDVHQRIAERNASVLLHWFGVERHRSLIGAGVMFGQTPDQIEIGYHIAADAAGQGLGTVVAKQLSRFAFETLGKKNVVARVSIDNDASMRVLEKGGFQLDGPIEFGASAYYGYPTPLYRFSLVREWLET